MLHPFNSSVLLPWVIISTVNEGLNKWVYVHAIFGPKNVELCTLSVHWIYKLQVFTEIIVSMVNESNNNSYHIWTENDEQHTLSEMDL